MRNVYFINQFGDERLIAQVYSDESAWAAIEEFCEKHKFKIYYVRTHESNGRRHYDVGSHVEHFSVDL